MPGSGDKALLRSRRRAYRGLRSGLFVSVPFSLLIAITLIAPAAFSQTRPGRSSPGLFPGSGVVTRVSDGDSLRIRFADGGERRLRLIGVNSPELDDPRESAAFWAFLAKRFVDFHLRGRSVRLEYDETPVDDYGRILAYVVTEDGALFSACSTSFG